MDLKAPLLPAVLLLVACSAEPGKNSAYDSCGFDIAKDAAGVSDAAKDSTETGTTPTTSFIIQEKQVGILLDSLSGERTDARLRWAHAITNTWPRSDGALSEALSQAGMQYTQKHTAEFLRHIVTSEDDMATWADLISGELMIVGDVDPLDVHWQYGDGLEQLCSDCTAVDRTMLRRFLASTKEKLTEKIAQ